jgi:hypothetical protein
MAYFKTIDTRSRKEMVEFLTNHFRYDTMRSWNRSTSYANNMKIYNLGLDKLDLDMAYDLLEMDDFNGEISIIIRDWDAEQSNLWKAGFNGGYLVLYQSKLEPTGHKSRCIKCGQLNFESITEGSNKCGRCGALARVDFLKTHMHVMTYAGRSTDQGEDFSDWDMYSLKERVRLVQSFDQLCDDIVAQVKYCCKAYKIVEKEICVPKTIKVLQAV